VQKGDLQMNPAELTQLIDEVVAKLRTMSPDARSLALAMIERELRSETAPTPKHRGGRPKGSKNRKTVGPNGADTSATIPAVTPLAVN
jgi:hypothetical protein